MHSKNLTYRLLGKHQKRVVIEHFLKMRNKELSVGGIAAEAESDVIEHAAAEICRRVCSTMCRHTGVLFYS